MRKLLSSTFFVIAAFSAAVAGSAAAGAALRQDVHLGTANGYRLIASDSAQVITRVADGSYSKLVTGMENGKLVSHIVAHFGRFSGTMQTETPADVADAWHQRYGS